MSRITWAHVDWADVRQRFDRGELPRDVAASFGVKLSAFRKGMKANGVRAPGAGPHRRPKTERRLTRALQLLEAGKSRRDAAAAVGWTEGTLGSRLKREGLVRPQLTADEARAAHEHAQRHGVRATADWYDRDRTGLRRRWKTLGLPVPVPRVQGPTP